MFNSICRQEGPSRFAFNGLEGKACLMLVTPVAPWGTWRELVVQLTEGLPSSDCVAIFLQEGNQMSHGLSAALPSLPDFVGEGLAAQDKPFLDILALVSVSNNNIAINPGPGSWELPGALPALTTPRFLSLADSHPGRRLSCSTAVPR
jgi:hypothetical protein